MRITVFLLCIFTTTSVFAEALGLPYGRTANFAEHGRIAIEGGVQLGDWDNYIARASYKSSDKLSVYGDLGFSDAGLGFGVDDSGPTIGAGVVFSLGQLVEGIDFAALGSFHLTNTDDIDLTDLAFRGTASAPIQLQDVTASWYASVGLEFLSVSVDRCRGCDNDETELAFGGGIIYPVGLGEVYGGIDYVDDFTIGGGFRINLD